MRPGVTTDRIKEELQWLRVVFQLAIASDAGLVTYLATAVTTRLVWILAAVALSFGIGLVVYVVITVYRLLRALEAPHDVP